MGFGVLSVGFSRMPGGGVLPWSPEGMVPRALLPLDSAELADNAKVDMLGLRYKSVNFGAENSPGSLKW